MIFTADLSEIDWLFVVINGVMGTVCTLGGISHIRNRKPFKTGKFLGSACYFQRWLGLMDVFRGLYLLGCVLFVADKPDMRLFCFGHFTIICFLGGKAASFGDVAMNFGMSGLTLFGFYKNL